jgi:hypothetical protein
VDQELIALACNMVASNGEDSSRNIEIMVASDGLHHMIKRAHQTHDALLLKLLRNIAEDVSFKPLFLRYLHELAGATTKAQNHDFLLEAVGTLANLNVPEAKFGDVARQHNLVDFIVKHMVPGFAEDDVLLQMVMLLGTICSDPQAGYVLHQHLLSFYLLPPSPPPYIPLIPFAPMMLSSEMYTWSSPQAAGGQPSPGAHAGRTPQGEVRRR